MIIGVKDLTWAKVSGGGAGAAMSYTGGAQETDLMVRADQSEDRADAAFYADDHAIDRDNSVTLEFTYAQKDASVLKTVNGIMDSIVFDPLM